MKARKLGEPIVRSGPSCRTSGEILAEPVLNSPQPFSTTSIAPKYRNKGLPPWPEITLIASTSSNRGEAWVMARALIPPWRRSPRTASTTERGPSPRRARSAAGMKTTRLSPTISVSRPRTYPASRRREKVSWAIRHPRGSGFASFALTLRGGSARSRSLLTPSYSVKWP